MTVELTDCCRDEYFFRFFTFIINQVPSFKVVCSVANYIKIFEIMMFNKFLMYLIWFSTFFVLWFEKLTYLAKELIKDQFVGWILWHFVYTWVGLGKVGGCQPRLYGHGETMSKISLKWTKIFPLQKWFLLCFLI